MLLPPLQLLPLDDLTALLFLPKSLIGAAATHLAPWIQRRLAQQGEHQKGGQHVHMSVRSPVGSFWLESLAADVGHQRFGQQDAAVGLLAVLQQGRHGSADGQATAIQGVN